MSDLADGSGHMPRRTRVGEGGAPVSGGLAIVLAVVAVVAGFLILRSITNGGENALDPPSSTLNPTGYTAEGTGDSTPGDATGSTVATLPTTSTTPEIVVAGASVVVANANSVGGSATAMSRALETGPGFTMVDPVNSSATVGDIETSVIYFVTDVPAAQQVATSLATVLGGVATIAPMPETPPTKDGSVNGAGVLLMLGNDKAGKTLAELAPDAAGGPVVVTNPPVAGQTTSTTTG